jgi:hypothetical protein
MTFSAMLNNEEMAEGTRAFAERREPGWVPEPFRRDGRI